MIQNNFIKAILFDCDGTLVDSEQTHVIAWELAFLDLGLTLTKENAAKHAGLPDNVIAQFFTEDYGNEIALELLEIKRRKFVELSKKGLPPIIHTVNFLKALGAKKEELGIKIGLCSGATKEEILVHIASLKIEHLFDIVLSGQDDLPEYQDPDGVNKPKPYVYLKAMEELSVFPHETIAIEDSLTGVKSGVAAGCYTVVIPNQHTKHTNFDMADLCLDSLQGVSIHELLNKAAAKYALPN